MLNGVQQKQLRCKLSNISDLPSFSHPTGCQAFIYCCRWCQNCDRGPPDIIALAFLTLPRTLASSLSLVPELQRSRASRGQ